MKFFIGKLPTGAQDMDPNKRDSTMRKTSSANIYSVSSCHEESSCASAKIDDGN